MRRRENEVLNTTVKKLPEMKQCSYLHPPQKVRETERTRRVLERKESQIRRCTVVKRAEPGKGPLGFVVKSLMTLRAQLE